MYIQSVDIYSSWQPASSYDVLVQAGPTGKYCSDESVHMPNKTFNDLKSRGNADTSFHEKKYDAYAYKSIDYDNNLATVSITFMWAAYIKTNKSLETT